DVRLPVAGRHSVENGLAAGAVGLAAGLSLDEVAAGLEAGWSAPHRGEIVETGGITIIDDAYNASPRSMAAALETLAGFPGRHVAVLGQMLELGDAEEAGHREVGEIAARTTDLLIVVGAGARGIAEGATATPVRPRDGVRLVADRGAALAALDDELRPGDVVLLKASRGVELDLLVEPLRSRGGRLDGPRPASTEPSTGPSPGRLAR
ncbi:MAG TPA: cyanophycin synthetase, partial [Candidatus Limnocylindrales bacterium]